MMRTFFLISSLAWRNLWRRGGRTALTIAAVAIAVMSLIVLGSLMRAWGDSAFDRTVESLTAHGQIHAPGFLEDPSVDHAMPPPSSGPDTALLRALNGPDIKAWTPRVIVPALIRSERESAPINLYGIDPAREKDVSFLKAEDVEGAWLADENAPGLIIGRQMAARLQTDLGRRVVISAQDKSGAIAEIGVRVVGFFKGQPDLQKYVAFISLGKAQKFLGLGNEISEIAYIAPSRDKIETATQALRAAAPGLDIQSWDTLRPFAMAIIKLTGNMNTIWVFISFALVSFGLVNTLMLAVFERMREFGLMQALGMKPRLMLAQILIESVYLVVFGTLAGAAAGMVIIHSLSGGLDFGSLAGGASMFGAGQKLYPHLDFSEVAFSCFIIIGLSICASLYPAFQAAKRVPVDILSRAQT